MYFVRAQALVAFLLVVLRTCVTDVLVQLNVNRPLNDVNEKFISFAVKPEDLYRALDGSNRKSLTRMAAMLGESYVKFVGDYYFAADLEKKLRNPTKVMWKGFNRWTRAVNWTMIIPVPYSPDSWDPMLALKILNSSYSTGITDCIWQLGTDFGATHAKDYVTELNTLNLMVDSFRPYVDDWQIIGADISAGSSAEETRRYIEMSKKLNSAFGWTHPAELSASNRLGNYIYSNDAALKVLLSKKVPVWLTLPAKSSNQKSANDVSEALSWAQSLGDAASAGFDAIFKRIGLSELEAPDPSFYVTALFKKVMGSRVFPARPLGLFAHSNKLYTHCANAVSGGIAFMVVNMEDTPVQISLRSITQLTTDEVWQYTLTFKDNKAWLNNEKLSLNSTMRPLKKAKDPLKPLQLNTPGNSVGFWVLPTVNLEHCQYTEIEAAEIERDTASTEDVRDKKYSSSDKLLKKLIRESALSKSALSQAINRRRRYATFSNRPKRFLLEDSRGKSAKGWGGFFEGLKFEEKPLKKRETALKERQPTMLDWILSLMEGAWHRDAPLLKRGTRSADSYFGSFFAAKDNEPTSTKNIFDKKPVQKIKSIFDQEDFDEEEFFKKMGEHTEPSYMRPPEGDVHMRHIDSLDGEEIEESKQARKKPTKRAKALSLSKEAFSEMKPLRLLPTEFYEALPGNAFKAGLNKMQIGSALNSLLFPEPFTRKAAKGHAKLKANKETEPRSKSDSGVEKVGTAKFQKNGRLGQDFLRAQMELGKTFLSDNDQFAADSEKTEKAEKVEKAKERAEKSEEVEEMQSAEYEKMELEKRKLIDFIAQNLESYFGERVEKLEATDSPQKHDEDVPWWHLSAKQKKRARRALRINLPDDAWQDNMIIKDDELTPLGASTPEKMAIYEYTVDNEVKNKAEQTKDSMSHAIVATVKRKVSNFVDILARHVSEWYGTLVKHIEIETTTARDNKS